MTLPNDADDLCFDAYDAIRDTIYAAINFKDVDILVLAHRLFRRHYDALAELQPQKALIYANVLLKALDEVPEGTSCYGSVWSTGDTWPSMKAEGEAFREDVMRRVVVNLLGNIERVISYRQEIDVVGLVVANTKDPGSLDMVAEAAIRKFTKTASWADQAEQTERLIAVAKAIGEKSQRFKEIVLLIVSHAERAEGQENIRKSLENCMSLARVMGGRGQARLSVLRCAAILTQFNAEEDPLAAEAAFQQVVALCSTRREKAEIVDGDTAQIVKANLAVRPLEQGEEAAMLRVMRHLQA
jgi:hypothetical protein